MFFKYMFFNYFLIIIYINLAYQKEIKNGVYNIIINNCYLYYYKDKIYISKNFAYPNTFFKIYRENKISENQLYLIEEIETQKRLSSSEIGDVFLDERKNYSQFWQLIETNENNYLIKNYNSCFISINNKNNVHCDMISIQNAKNFKLNLIYKELKEKEKNNTHKLELLNKEPIDILIKYIDLRDPNLIRYGIHQIEKDYDNEELKYSVRSIMKNIPWIRKIFILMPNEKVRFFKEYNLINDKIVYVKDKDLLGYDSSNCNAFLYRYWQMKKFGISDNIILMDDDFFIRDRLEKKDFFYVKNDKVVPFITTSNFVKIEKEKVQKNCEIYEKKAKTSKEEQNEDIFQYVKFLTYNFLFTIFNESENKYLFVPFYTHNAIPINLNDAREVYELVYKSKYKYGTLDCLYRYYEFIHFQILIAGFTFIKYKRKVNHISHKYVQLNNSLIANYRISLFCINKGAGYYPFLQLYKAKIVMEYLFPTPSPFEKIDNSFNRISFNTAYTMDKNQRIYEKQKKNMISKSEFYNNIIYLLVIFFIISLKNKIRNDEINNFI